MKKTKSLAYIFVGLLIVLLPSLSLAEVDGNEDSVEKDRSHFGATESIRKSLKYKIYDLAAARNNVHEYVDKSGHVFAVTWDGRIPPDLSVIFGKHYDDYNKTLTNYPRAKGRRNFQSLVTSKLKITQYGHLGHYAGSAFVIGTMPEDVSTDEILRDATRK